jgi:S1-C subfamily serine protease
VLPPSGAILNALARFDPFPHVSGPPLTVAAPPPGIARAPGVHAAAASSVRVLGTACGLGIEGSGWVAAPGVVVTNAHVVAGESDTIVQAEGVGPKLSATAIAFDPTDDVAVLRVSGLAAPPLVLGPDPRAGTAGAVIGYPLDGPLDIEPGRVGATVTAISQDAYGQGPIQREITSLRARVRSGNSGGPIVDAAGHVLTTVFAATVGAGPAGGYGVPNDRVRAVLATAHGAVGTGPCAR